MNLLGGATIADAIHAVTKTCRQLLFVSAALLAVACSSSQDGQGRGGEWLTDIESVDCSAVPVASFSADGEWLLFWIQHFQADSGMQLPVVSPALLELDSRRQVLLAGPVDRIDGPSFAPSSLCWNDVGQAVYVSTERLRVDSDLHWYRADIGLDSELVPVPGPPDSCRRPPEVQWDWHRGDMIPGEVRGDLEVFQDGCCAVELRRTDGRVLARHEARGALSDLVLISRFAWSEHGSRLVYTLSEQTNWRFARPSVSFVVEPSGQSQLLAGQLFAFAWRGDQELIACARRPQSAGGGNGLKIWRFEPGE